MDDSARSENRKYGLIVAVVSASVFMFSIDYSMLNISLPSITKYFNATIGSVSRLPLAYLLVVTSTVLLFGKLGDIFGLKKIFTTGLLIFIAGTSLCTLAPTLDILFILRIVQCFGEAMFSPIGIAIITTALPPSTQGRALGIMATAQGLGFSLGPLLGGFINTHMSWHGIFLVNIPIGICVAVAAFKILPSKKEVNSSEKIDYLGAVLIFTSLAPLIYALNSIGKLGFNNPVVIACLSFFAVALVVFIIREKTTPYPLLDITLFRKLDFTSAVLSAFFAIFVYMGLLFLFPFYLNMVKGLDAMRSGLFLMAPATMVMIFAPLAGMISDKIGARKVCSFGMAMTGAAFFMFSLLTPKSSPGFILPSLIVAGIAIGCFLPANNKLVMAHAPLDKQGMGSAVYKIVMSLGGIFGIAVIPLVLMEAIYAKIAVLNMTIQEVKNSPEVMMVGFDAAFRFGMFMCIAGLVFALLAKDKK